MATLESIAIRRARALERILATTETMGSAEGLQPVDVVVNRRDPRLGEAMLLENIAQWLEDYANAQLASTVPDMVAAAIEGKGKKSKGGAA